ncbi:MAG: hypothetical protein AAF394_18130, partial [Planctomycetota bacterium]
ITELDAQHFVVDEEWLAAILLRWMLGCDPPLAVERRAASRHQRMNVRVMIELLVSGMQNQVRSRLKPRFTKRFVQCSPGGVEQQVIQWLAVTQD